MPKLVNFGSLCIDHVYQVPRLAGSGETVASTAHELFPGGKGLNQSLAAARAGSLVHHVGAIGEDGDSLLAVLAQAGVVVAGVRRLPGVSGHAVIQVDAEGRNAIVIAGGANRQLSSDDVNCVFDLLQPDDWLLLQNETSCIAEILDRAGQADVQVAFNVAPADGREAGYDLSAVRLLIVNELEAAALTGCAAPRAALEALAGQWPRSAHVLTLGAQGLWFCEARQPGPGGSPGRHLAAYRIEAVDETAAGDAFIGYLLAGLLDGAALEKALRAASAAGALAATRAGAATSIPGPQEVWRLLDSERPLALS